MTVAWPDLLNAASKLALPANDCQGFVANHMCAMFGEFVDGYDSANDALAASKALGTFHAGELPPDGVIVCVFFDYPVYGHDGLYYNGQTVWDSSHCSAFLNAAKTIGVGTIELYPYKYLGYSTTNGRNTLPQITPPAAPTPPAPNVRTTVAAGAHVRLEPEVINSPSNIASTLKGDWAYPVDKWIHGTAPEAGDTDVWFFIAGGWASAIAFTNQSTDGITDGNPVAPPVVTPPVVVDPPVTPPVVTTPPVTVPPVLTPPTSPIVDPPTTTPVVTTPAKPVTPTKPTTPTTHPSATAFGFTAIAAAVAAIVGFIATWIQSR